MTSLSAAWNGGRSRESSRLTTLLALALALRLLFLFLAGVDAPLSGDELAYQQIAAHVAEGHGFWQDNNPFFPYQVLYAWQAPLYPLSLAIIYLVFGQHLLLAKLFGILISTATVYLTYDVAARLFEDWRAAFASGLLLAIYPGFLTSAHLLLSETLFSFCVMLTFDVVLRSVARPLRVSGGFVYVGFLAAAGVAWGLATLTRGAALYFAPLFALWIGWVVHRTPGGGIQRGVAAGLVFIAGTAVVIAPWTMRNATVFHRFVLLETKGGVNFWFGNSPDTPRQFIRNVWKVGVREPMLGALPRDEVERDRAAYRLGLAYVAREPWVFIARMPVKFADFWGFERNLSDVAESTGPGRGWRVPSKLAADSLSALVYVAVTIAAIFGFTLGPDAGRGESGPPWKLLLGGFVVYFCVSHLVVFGDGRFHLPLIPVLALYGGWFVANLRRATYTAAAVAAGASGVVVLAAILLHEGLAAWETLRRATTPL